MPAFKGHTTGTTDTAWDGPAQKTKVRSDEKRAYYGKIFAWYDPDADEGNKSDYKFIHHQVAENGDPGDANTNGCSAGIGVLNGGRGGTKIPEADRQGVYDHLAKHIRDAGKEPPDLTADYADTADARLSNFEYGEILRRATAEAWAILPTALQALLAIPAHLDRENGVQAVTRPGPKSGRLAQVPIRGSISRRDSFWSMLFGGASVEGLIKTLREVGADDSIKTVLLDVDSPGGTVSGIPELANEVRRLSERKHVVAMANSLMASAAYWIASQADEIVAAPEALVGSVGVFAIHEDWSRFLEQAGVKISYIAAGKYKVDGNFESPLSDEARAHMQSIVDDAYGLFVGDVARGRGVTAAAVKSDYGEGRVLTARDAKTAGMIDRVAGFEETIQRLAGSSTPLRSAQNAARNDIGGKSLAKRRLEIAEKTFVEVER